MSSERLRAAIDLAKSGQRQQAKALLIALLKENPKEELAWLWVVDLIDQPQEKIIVLERARAMNPESDLIQEALAHFKEETSVITPTPSFDVHTQYANETEPAQKKSFWRWARWILIAGITLTMGLTLFFAWPSLKNALSTPLAMLQDSSITQSPPALPTWTPQASPTATITPTPTPALPLHFGESLPKPAASISIWDAEQLVPFAQWGKGILLAAAWMPGDQITAISSRGFDQFSPADNAASHQGLDSNAIQLAGCSADGQIRAWSTSDKEIYLQLSSQSSPILLETQLEQFQQLFLSPDGQRLALVTASDQVEIWNTTNQQHLSTIDENFGRVESLSFSPDNQMIAIGNQWGFVWFFDPQSGTEINKFYDQEGSIQSLGFSQDGKFLAAGSTAQSVVLFDLEEMAIHHHIYDLGQTVTSLVFGSTNQILAFGLENGEIILWDDNARLIVDQFSRHRAAIQGLAFNQTGNRLLSWAADGTLLSWQITISQRVDAFRPGIPGSIFTSAITPDGKRIALAGSDSQIHLFDLASELEIATLKGHVGSVWYLAISADGKKMISGGRDGRVQLWSLESFEQIAELGRHSSYVRGVAFSDDGVLAASASADEMIRVWDTTTLEELFILVGHTDQVQSISFSSDNSQLISVADDGTIRIWDLSNGQMVNVIENEGLTPLYAVQTLPQTTRFLTGDSAGKLSEWNSTDQQRLATLPGHTTEINTIAITADGSLAASGDADGTVIVWQLAGSERLRILEGHTNPIVGLEFSNDALAMYSIDRSGLVLRWDMRTMEPPTHIAQYTSPITSADIVSDQTLAAFSSIDQSITVVDLQLGAIRYQIKNLSAGVNTLTFSPAGTHLAAGLENGGVVMWDTQKGYQALQFNSTFAVTSMTFEPTGRVLLIGRSNHSIERRDIRTGELLETLWGHSGRVEALAFAPNEVTMASGSADGKIFIWDMDDNSILHRIPAHQDTITDLQFSSDGTQLFSTAADGSVRVWRVTNAEKLIEYQSGIPITGFQNLTTTQLISVSAAESKLCLWDAQQSELFPCLDDRYGQIQALSFNPAAQTLLTIDSDGCIQQLAVAESTAPEALPTQQAAPTAAAAVENENQATAMPSVSEKLPASLYFLSNESGSSQVWRLSSDAASKTQITTEEFPVTSFDVSRNTDHLAFVSNNQLILVDKEGENRLILVEGEPFPRNDLTARLQKEITDLVFSPDGWRIAFSQNGAHVYSILDNRDVFLIENKVSESQQNQVSYHPTLFSPGGTNLYLQVETQSGYSLTVLNSQTGEVYADTPVGACCQPSLNHQQDAVFFTGRDRFGNAVGLWSIDIWHDQLTEILPSNTGAGTYQINAFPKQAPDGTLYFFYAESDVSNQPPLILASSASDGTSLLKTVRAETYSKLTDVLWSDSAEFVLISDPETQEILFLKTEDVPPILLPIRGTMMRWGE